MGMYDTFLVPHRGTVKEIQTKKFGCFLSLFSLGNFLDDECMPGVGVVTDSFTPDLEHVNHLFERQSNFERDLGVAYVIINGRWVDYAIYPTEKIAEICSKELITRYKNQSWQAFAWQCLEHIQRQSRYLFKEKTNNLMRFIIDFESRNEPRRIKKHFNIFKQLPKKSLTWNNLLEETKKTIKTLHSMDDKKELYRLWNTEIEQKEIWYHFNNANVSHMKADNSLHEVNLYNLSDEASSKHLKSALDRLDLLFFKVLASKKPDWFSNTSPSFQKYFQSVMGTLPSTLLGSFLWVKLLGLSKITPQQKYVYKEGFHLPLSLHLMEVMGLEDELLAEAAQTAPNLLVSGSTLHPIHSLPLSYNKTLATLGEMNFDILSKETDDQGNPPLIQALQSVLSFDRANIISAFERAAWWLERGADPNQPDANGNTPLMWLVSFAAKNVNYSWVWSVEQNHRGYGQSKQVIQTLLQAASFSQTNKKGQTLLDLWPNTKEACIMMSLEEKRRLSSNNKNEFPNETVKAL